ncbi:hypothetical protein BGZ68_002807 [Mortierella alpina]|nr:hypothetical protein BGZ68_002807 [Mortierella alpina]
MSWLHSKKHKEKEREKEAAALSASFNSSLQIRSSSPPNAHTNGGLTQSSSTANSSSTVSSTHSNGSGTASGTSTRGDGPTKNGLLIIRVVEARGLTLPSELSHPPFVPKEQQHQAAVSNRESLQRKWWLPYAVLEFDKNEVLIDALGGEVSNPVWQYRAHFDVSRDSDVQLSLYIRIPNPNADAKESESSSQDVFLGNVNLEPRWDDQMQDAWFPLHGGTGKVRVQLAYKRDNANVPLTIDAFDLLKVIGKGSFGKVMQVRKRDTSRIYAMKILRKAHIISRSEVNHTLAERTVLAQINNPFIVPLKFSFQSPEKLYLVLAFVNGGELFHHLQREGRFSEERSRFYAAELLCALECLHGFNVVYRDLKPENILLDYTGHIALCDFGLCKLGMTETETTNTFCGTPEYLAPELLLGQGYTKTVDWWTLGVLLYEMLTGLPPFYDENIHEMYRKILQDELRFPDEVSSEARSLLSALLTRDPNQRLGNNGSSAIKQHPFFKPISFSHLMAKKIQPPFKPSVSSATDTSNFDEEFTSEEPLDSVVESSFLSETVQLQFKGFTYNPAHDGVLGASMANPGLSTSGGRGSNGTSSSQGNGAGHQSRATPLFNIPTLNYSKFQQARLQIYMTTLHSYTQHSNNFESTLLHDYETVSALELVSFPETSEDVDFKSSLRQRSFDRAQKKQVLDSRFVGVRREEQRERQKAEQRRQQLLQHQKQKQSSQDKNDKNNNSSSRSSSNNDHHKSDSHADRSKKRADRHRRAVDTILALEQFSDSSEVESEADEHLSDDGYSRRRHGRSGRSSSSSSSSRSSTDNDDDSEEGDENDLHERIRFKRNLTFKTDDDGTMASTRVDSRLWKQVFVQKLDEKDQARERKKDNSRSHKRQQGGKHQNSLL